MITISENAILKIKEIIPTDSFLRIYVKGGGCTGFQYGFEIETDSNDDDTIIESNGIKVLVDSTSSQYLEGSEVNYTTSIAGSSFVVKNPNATAQCGCGKSFSA